MITKELLESIKVLFQAPNGGLYGIPYEMKRDCGQQPMDIWRAHYEYDPPPPGWYGSKQVKIHDWIWLGSGGWLSSMTPGEIELIREYLKPLRDRGVIPQYPGEWSTISDFTDPKKEDG